MRTKQKFNSEQDVRRIADETGSYYFSPDTMRWFNSRLLMGFFPTKEDRTEGLIIVSNRNSYAQQPREYNVVHVGQEFDEDGKLRIWFNTIESFYSTGRARTWARKEADNLKEVARENKENDHVVNDK